MCVNRSVLRKTHPFSEEFSSRETVDKHCTLRKEWYVRKTGRAVFSADTVLYPKTQSPSGELRDRRETGKSGSFASPKRDERRQKSIIAVFFRLPCGKKHGFIHRISHRVRETEEKSL